MAAHSAYSLACACVAVDSACEQWLFDRRRVYSILKSIGVPVPKHVCYDASDPSVTVDDSDEWLEINGVRLAKPLVEKPISGEDHNIHIYYPRSQGGGSKRLFRKVRTARGGGLCMRVGVCACVCI